MIIYSTIINGACVVVGLFMLLWFLQRDSELRRVLFREESWRLLLTGGVLAIILCSTINVFVTGNQFMEALRIAMIWAGVSFVLISLAAIKRGSGLNTLPLLIFLAGAVMILNTAIFWRWK